MKADEIKCLLVDFMLNRYSDLVIINELQYGTERRRADLSLVADGKSIAFEIKSEADTIEKLNSQLTCYKKVFDYIYIVTNACHVNEIYKKNINMDGVGIILLDKSELHKIKKSKRIVQNLDKKEILYSVSTIFLKEKFPELKKMKVDDLREVISRKNKNTIHEIYIEYLTRKFKCNIELLKKDKTSNCTVDDIILLSAGGVVYV